MTVAPGTRPSPPAPTRRMATYADVLAAPPHVVAEILDGELVTHPRPAPKHAIAASALGGELAGPWQRGRGGPGGWIFAVEPELHWRSDVVVPDIAGWRRERLPHLPETAYFETPPDWVCEVLSPSTEKWDRGVKRDIYARAGVSHLWLVDARARLIESFALTEGRWLLLGAAQDEAEARLSPFDAVPLELAALWPLGPPAASAP
jgi:Uma2 family endonuclease